MLKHKIERFLTYISMQMPSLMSRANYAGAEIFDGMAILEFKLPKPFNISDLLDEFDDQMELIILYHIIPSEATVMGHQCCAYSNPSFDYLYKVNGISDDNGICDTLYASLYDSLENFGLDLQAELNDQTAKSKVVFARKEEDLLRDFMK